MAQVLTQQHTTDATSEQQPAEGAQPETKEVAKAQTKAEEDWANRPARRQAKGVKRPPSADSTQYNIWYHKYCGERQYNKRHESREVSAYRCNPARDSGLTRCNFTEKKGTSYICLYFARGKCVMGPDCTFLHRLPNEEDEANLSITYDIFGRERHATDRDDMGGVGSFSRENRTLYIGGLLRLPGVDLEEAVRKNFSEWGELEYVRVILSKSIAFVRYKLRVCAEFAKEAMADQSLGHGEVINVRWANEDPNPAAKAALHRESVERVTKAVQQKHSDFLQYGMHGYDPAQKNPLHYPNTDTQYPLLPAASGASSSSSSPSSSPSETTAHAEPARDRTALQSTATSAAAAVETGPQEADPLRATYNQYYAQYAAYYHSYAQQYYQQYYSQYQPAAAGATPSSTSSEQK